MATKHVRVEVRLPAALVDAMNAEAKERCIHLDEVIRERLVGPIRRPRAMATMTVRLPKSLREAIHVEAAEEGVTSSMLVVSKMAVLLADTVRHEPKPHVDEAANREINRLLREVHGMIGDDEEREIIEKVESGIPKREVAAEHRITTARVGQIVSRWRKQGRK